MAHTPEKARPLASKLKRIYAPRIISDHIMVQEDFERLHKFLLETEGLLEVSHDMRQLVEDEWPELVHKLPPKVPTRRSYGPRRRLLPKLLLTQGQLI